VRDDLCITDRILVRGELWKVGNLVRHKDVVAAIVLIKLHVTTLKVEFAIAKELGQVCQWDCALSTLSVPRLEEAKAQELLRTLVDLNTAALVDGHIADLAKRKPRAKEAAKPPILPSDPAVPKRVRKPVARFCPPLPAEPVAPPALSDDGLDQDTPPIGSIVLVTGGVHQGKSGVVQSSSANFVSLLTNENVLMKCGINNVSLARVTPQNVARMARSPQAGRKPSWSRSQSPQRHVRDRIPRVVAAVTERSSRQSRRHSRHSRSRSPSPSPSSQSSSSSESPQYVLVQLSSTHRHSSRHKSKHSSHRHHRH